MIRFLTLAIFFSLAFALPVPAASDDEVAAHRVALELAGAFSNAGFKIRDGNWSGPIAPKQSVFVQVNLYSGNEYWFCVGATDKAKKVVVTVFDENGLPVTPSDTYQDGIKSAVGFSPTSSGAYIIRVQETDGAAASYCMLYSYK